MSYTQLTEIERYQIQSFLKAGYTQKAIAEELGRNSGTISRELIPILESFQISAQSLEQRLCIRPSSVVKFIHASVATLKISS